MNYDPDTLPYAPGYISKRLQSAQTRILKMLLHKKRTDSASAIYRNLQILNLKQLHELFVLIFVYKQQHNLLPAIYNEYYVRVKATTDRITRQSENILIEKYRTNQGQKTIKFVGGKLWNILPNDIKESSSVNTFKLKCKGYILNK